MLDAFKRKKERKPTVFHIEGDMEIVYCVIVVFQRLSIGKTDILIGKKLIDT
jgi:hypothetical protein